MRIRVGPNAIVLTAALVAIPVLIWFAVDPDSAGPVLGWLLVPLVGIPVLCMLLLLGIAVWKRRRTPPPPDEES